MFIGTRARIAMALAAMGGIFRTETVGRAAPERRYWPVLPTPAIDPARLRAPRGAARIVSRTPPVRIRPRQEGAMARRRRQIKAITLQGSNGLLVVIGDRRLHWDSHGNCGPFYG